MSNQDSYIRNTSGVLATQIAYCYKLQGFSRLKLHIVNYTANLLYECLQSRSIYCHKNVIPLRELSLVTVRTIHGPIRCIYFYCIIVN